MCIRTGSNGPLKDGRMPKDTSTGSDAVTAATEAGGSASDGQTAIDQSTSTPDGANVSAQLLITEVMINPSDSSDNGEWFEVYNPGSAALNINGWTIKSGSETHQINNSGTLNVPAKGYIVLDRKSVV